MKNYAFLFWGYNVVWLGLAAYLLFLFRRLEQTRRRLDALERQLCADRSISEE